MYGQTKNGSTTVCGPAKLACTLATASILREARSAISPSIMPSGTSISSAKTPTTTAFANKGLRIRLNTVGSDTVSKPHAYGAA